MYKKFLIVTFLISHVFFSNSFGEEEKVILVNFEKNLINNNLIIKTSFKNNKEEKVTVILKTTAEKRGKAGKSKIFQSNFVNLEAYEEKCLSRVVLNLESGEEYKVIIEAYENNKLIAKESIR